MKEQDYIDATNRAKLRAAWTLVADTLFHMDDALNKRKKDAMRLLERMAEDIEMEIEEDKAHDHC